jgi:hypothetical protein
MTQGRERIQRRYAADPGSDFFPGLLLRSGVYRFRGLRFIGFFVRFSGVRFIARILFAALYPVSICGTFWPLHSGDRESSACFRRGQACGDTSRISGGADLA